MVPVNFFSMSLPRGRNWSHYHWMVNNEGEVWVRDRQGIDYLGYATAHAVGNKDKGGIYLYVTPEWHYFEMPKFSKSRLDGQSDALWQTFKAEQRYSKFNPIIHLFIDLISAWVHRNSSLIRQYLEISKKTLPSPPEAKVL